MKAGLYRLQFPCRQWRTDEYRHWLAPGFPVDPGELLRQWRKEGTNHFVPESNGDEYSSCLAELAGRDGAASIEAEAEAIRRGRFRYFFKEGGDLGIPPDWSLNPFHGGRAPNQAHWSSIPVHSGVFGDIKYIWEPGRFAAAYTLSRAYRATGDEAHAECFWQLVESWGIANPPNHGPHWRCGQEISLRLMAWAFALHVFKESPATTPDRFVRMLGMIAAQAHRVAGTTLYAHLQENNHSISEGAGLWTLGILFPMLAGAEAWRRKGRDILEKDAFRLLCEDGSFSQKSNNYHRLMLHDYLYCLRLGEVNGFTLDTGAVRRIGKAAVFLLNMMDPTSGWAPNTGGNDGALILPLNCCDYNDMRPVVAAVHYFFNKERIFDTGPWHEDLYWFYGPEALQKEPCRPRIEEMAASEGGFHTIRGDESWAMLRCGPNLQRPRDPDSLHLDLWWRGRNIAMDPGSYRYYDAPPWNNGLQSTRCHNTVSVDGVDQLERGPRFMWVGGHDARLLWRGRQRLLSCIEAEHDGYSRLAHPVRHRRAVLRAADVAWIVIDDLSGEEAHELELQWLISWAERRADGPFQRLDYPEGSVWFLSLALEPEAPGHAISDWVEHPVESNVRGWCSRYYGVREPALSFRLRMRYHVSARLLTIFSFHPWRHVHGSSQRVLLEDDDRKLVLRLNPAGRQSMLHDAELFLSGEEEILTHS
jgi:asparagine synthase (glutamine-hydrolysing)